MVTLHALSALDDEGLLTRLGRRVRRLSLCLPLSPSALNESGGGVLFICSYVERFSSFAFISI